MSYDAKKLEGYELGYGNESFGADFFGLKIFVKMSDRKIDQDKDHSVLSKGARLIEQGLRTVTAELDPEGPATRERYRKQVEKIFTDAGAAVIFMEPIPNEYCGEACCLNFPWFIVTSQIGHVKIGWRKSVMNIDWSRSIVNRTGQEMFPEEPVTKGDRYIHAYGTDIASRYVKVLLGWNATAPGHE